MVLVLGGLLRMWKRTSHFLKGMVDSTWWLPRMIILIFCLPSTFVLLFVHNFCLVHLWTQFVNTLATLIFVAFYSYCLAKILWVWSLQALNFVMVCKFCIVVSQAVATKLIRPIKCGESCNLLTLSMILLFQEYRRMYIPLKVHWCGSLWDSRGFVCKPLLLS